MTIVFFSFCLSFSIAFSIYSGSISVAAIMCACAAVGFALCSWNRQSPLEADYARRAFSFVFVVYTMCAFFSVGYYRFCGEEFRFVIDQNKFLEYSEWALGEGSLWAIFRDTYLVRADLWGDIALFRFAQGAVAHVAQNYLGGSSVEALIAFSVGISSFVSIFIFKILSFRFSEKDALKYTLIFSCFSYLLYYSPLIIRDMPVLLAWSIAFWFFFLSFSWLRLFGMFIIMLCCFSLRPESGLLFFPVVVMYVWVKMKGNPWKPLVVVFAMLIGLGSLLAFWGRVVLFFQDFANIALGYVEFTTDENTYGGGLARYIAVLPPGIREATRILNGLFPGVTVVSTVGTFFSGRYSYWDIGHLSLLCIGHVFLLVLSLKCCINAPKLCKLLRCDPVMLYSGVGAVILILGNSFSYAHRRVLFAYLFLYVLFLFATKSRTFLKK